MPVMEPADESGHYAHILYIWKQGRLPDLAELPPTEKGVGYTTYPPLYYWSLIPLAKIVDAPLESEEMLPYHPQKEFFKKSVFAVYLHTKDELLFKWNKLAAAVHLLRLQTSVYGLLTVYLVYLTGKKMFGENSRKPLLAVALVGLNPMFSHISNSIVNVNLNILLFSLFFYLTMGSFVNFPLEKFSKLNFILGLIAGAAYLTKITGLMLIPVWAVFIAVNFYRFKVKPGIILKSILVFAIGFMLTAGWYLARNFRLYGSLLETGVAIKHFGRPAMQLEISGPVNYWTGFVQTNFKTFFSGYGMLTIHLPDGILFLLLVIVLAGVWGIIISKRDNPLRRLLEGSSLVILIGHIWVNINVEAFHARDLFIGMVPFSLLLIDGASVWLKQLESGKLWSRKIISHLMFLIFLAVALFHFLQPVLAEFVKQALVGFQASSPGSIKLAGFTIVFCIFWLAFRIFGRKMALTIVEISSDKNYLLNVAGGLFLTNILILILLVIPKLYRL